MQDFIIFILICGASISCQRILVYVFFFFLRPLARFGLVFLVDCSSAGSWPTSEYSTIKMNSSDVNFSCMNKPHHTTSVRLLVGGSEK